MALPSMYRPQVYRVTLLPEMQTFVGDTTNKKKPETLMEEDKSKSDQALVQGEV